MDHRHHWRKDDRCRCGMERPEGGKVPVAPRYLSEEAKNEWRRLAPQLVEKGLLEELDHNALATYCIACAKHKKALEMLNGPAGYCPNCDPRGEPATAADYASCNRPDSHILTQYGGVIRNRRLGKDLRSPYAAEAKEAEAQMVRLEGEFGMTPASRSRLPATRKRGQETAKPKREQSMEAPKDTRSVLQAEVIARQN